MRRYFYFLLIFIFSLFFCISDVLAADLCTERKYEVLKENASVIELDWELKLDENKKYYFEVTASKVHEDLMFKYGGVTYEPVDGKVKFYNLFKGGNTYYFKIYGGYNHSCVEEYVVTKSLKIPNYNEYSNHEICQGDTSKWEICNEWYDISFSSEEDFLIAFEEYKEKVENGEIIIDDDSDNFLIILLVIVALVVVVFVLYKKKIFKILFSKKRKNKK